MLTTVGRKSNKGIDCCGHEHDTRDQAQACLAAHQNEMRKRGLTSERIIIEMETLDEVLDND